MKGWLSRQTCPECGQRLWEYRLDVAEPARMFRFAICPRCDKPPEDGMLPRLKHPVTGEPVAPPARRDPGTDMTQAGFLIGMMIAVVIAVVIVFACLWQFNPILAIIAAALVVWWLRRA